MDTKIDDTVEVDLEKFDTKKSAKILAIGGGKGGVGKTVIAASLGVGLAMFEKHVVLVDADLGGANLHAVIGMKKPDRTYYDFYCRDYKRLSDITMEHPHFQNLKFISGAVGSLGIANLPFYQKMKFIRHLYEIDADFVILDLGTGSNYNVLDFFLAADRGIVVVNPDQLSIYEGFNFMRQAFFRKMIRIFKDQNGILDIIKKYAREETHKKHHTVDDLIEEVTRINEIMGKKIVLFLKKFNPMLVINEIRDSKDEINSLVVRVATRALLSIEMDYLGSIHQDSTVKRSLYAMEPFISFDPESRVSKDLIEIIETKILRVHHNPLKWVKIKKNGINCEGERYDNICSIQCCYWNICEFRNGGYPCEMGWKMRVLNN